MKNRSSFVPRRSQHRKNHTFDRIDCKDVPPYCVIDLTNGDCQVCKSYDHICAVAFGKNKRTHTQNWIACIRGDGFFAMA